MSSKKDEHTKDEAKATKVLGTGASGDPMNPALGSPAGSPALLDEAVVEEKKTTTAKETHK